MGSTTLFYIQILPILNWNHMHLIHKNKNGCQFMARWLQSHIHLMDINAISVYSSVTF